MDRLITEHDKRVADTLEKLEGSKQRQMQDLLQRLAQKRNQSEVAMKRQHKQEAEEAGLTLEEDEDGDAFATLLEQGIALDLLFAEEASGKANALAEQNKKLREELQLKMSENLSNAMVYFTASCFISNSTKKEHFHRKMLTLKVNNVIPFCDSR